MDPSPSPLRIRVGLDGLDESWKAIAVGFLVEKARRTGSRRTTEVYGRTVGRFLSGITDPGSATPLDVHRFAYGLGPSACPPSASTVSVRLAAVSGFYEFARRMEILDRNPAASVRRPQARRAPPRGLAPAEVTRLLAVIPETPAGLLDRALIVTALLTGLRRSELVGCRLLDWASGGTVRYEARTKGGSIRRRELPPPAWQAIVAAARAAGRPVAGADARAFPISDATFYAHLRRYGEVAGLGRVSPHVLRHSAAKLRRGAGATIEDVSRLLGHRSIATTSIYLRELEDERDDGWRAVAPLIEHQRAGRGANPRHGGGRWIKERPGGRRNAHPVQAIGGHWNADPSRPERTPA